MSSHITGFLGVFSPKVLSDEETIIEETKKQQARAEQTFKKRVAEQQFEIKSLDEVCSINICFCLF
jgi:hypothetical protein